MSSRLLAGQVMLATTCPSCRQYPLMELRKGGGFAECAGCNDAFERNGEGNWLPREKKGGGNASVGSPLGRSNVPERREPAKRSMVEVKEEESEEDSEDDEEDMYAEPTAPPASRPAGSESARTALGRALLRGWALSPNTCAKGCKLPLALDPSGTGATVCFECEEAEAKRAPPAEAPATTVRSTTGGRAHVQSLDDAMHRLSRELAAASSNPGSVDVGRITALAQALEATAKAKHALGQLH